MLCYIEDSQQPTGVRMDWDTIEALAEEAIQQLAANNQAVVFARLGEIKGHASAMMLTSSIWDVIQADYEMGIKPRELAKKYRSHGISITQIYNRASSGRWVSNTKINKALKATRNRSGNVFYPKCRECEQPFEAYSGASIICNTCKAHKMRDEGLKRVKG